MVCLWAEAVWAKTLSISLVVVRLFEAALKFVAEHSIVAAVFGQGSVHSEEELSLVPASVLAGQAWAWMLELKEPVSWALLAEACQRLGP